MKHVAATNILARMIGPSQQLLVYEMELSAAADVAMILPIPVPPRSADDAVRFRSLEHYPRLFKDLEDVFPHLLRGGGRATPGALPTLAVHSVGAFFASFVPSLADFDRVDRRFRLPRGTLDKIPGYGDWGFAVFQLSATGGPARVHPMAFEFRTRMPTTLFFPTVHVHNGKLHPYVGFSHTLYAQGVQRLANWEHTAEPLPDHARQHARELLDVDATISRLRMIGEYPNTDVFANLPAR